MARKPRFTYALIKLWVEQLIYMNHNCFILALVHLSEVYTVPSLKYVWILKKQSDYVFQILLYTRIFISEYSSSFTVHTHANTHTLKIKLRYYKYKTVSYWDINSYAILLLQHLI